MQRWEYRVVYLVECPDVENLLNNLGKEGWELVAIERAGAYFKRLSLPRPHSIKGPTFHVSVEDDHTAD